MQWTHTTRRGRRFHSGLAAWTNAGSPRSRTWRWLARPFDGPLVRPCPLLEFCPSMETRSSLESAEDPEGDPASAGSLAMWLALEDAYDPWADDAARLN